MSRFDVREIAFMQREIVSSKNFDPLLAAANSSVNIRRPTSLGDNSSLMTTGVSTGQTCIFCCFRILFAQSITSKGKSILYF